jgi:hypothetical protein
MRLFGVVFMATQGTRMKLLSLLFILSFNAFAVKLSDYTPYEYKVYFTNPECAEYKYEETVYANDGSILEAKPKNVYCKRLDADRNKKRFNSPHFQIKKLINDKNVKEIFFTFLSFSDSAVGKTICKNIEERGLKVTFIIDSKNNTPERVEQGALKNLNRIKACGAQTHFRGGTKGLGYAHNKVIITNPSGKNGKATTIVYGSGNMSSGTHMHHENWHFVTTNLDSYFAQKHLCLMDGMLTNGGSKKAYSKFLKECIAKIKTEEEEDVKTYFVPGEGDAAIKNFQRQGRKSIAIDAAAHRVMLPEFLNTLRSKAQAGYKVRFVVDDDIYYSKLANDTVGSNTVAEYYKIRSLFTNGVDVRYMETNQGNRYLHHNKFMIFDFGGNQGGVHAGAGNFTRAAFTKNYENFYYITIPEVVEAFKKQYEYKFNDLATSYYKLPKVETLP